MGPILVRFLATLRDGFRIWWLAPLVPALVVVPEFAQHVAEIRIGMFESKDAFDALAQDPRRMVWGYAKLAGLLLAILATVRFWGSRGSQRAWWDLRGVAWKGFLIAVVLIVATSVPGTLLESRIGADAAGWIDIALALATLPLLYLLVAALAGDRALRLREAFRLPGWLASLRLLVFAAAVWVPLQWWHGMNHEWAIGAAGAAVWALMVVDSLVVGLLATMAGSAFWNGIQPVTPSLPRVADAQTAVEA